MEASRARKSRALKRTKENFEEREIAVKSLFWGENDKKMYFLSEGFNFKGLYTAKSKKLS